MAGTQAGDWSGWPGLGFAKILQGTVSGVVTKPVLFVDADTVVENTHLQVAFPEMKGFSPRNLKYMRRFAELWPEVEVVQQLLHNLPWFHLCTIIDKAVGHRDWYAQAAVEHGWSRAVLVMQIETAAHERFGRASTNFERNLPAPLSGPRAWPPRAV